MDSNTANTAYQQPQTYWPPAPEQPPESQPVEPPQSVEPPRPATPHPDPTPQPEESAVPSNNFFPDYLRPVQEEVFFEWDSQSRPFKKRNRRYFTTVVTISLLVSLILFFAGQFLPIAVVVAVAFLAYVLATIPPQEVTQKVTSFGLRLEDQLYYWEELGRFWFTQKYGQDLLQVEMSRFPNRLTIVLFEMPVEDMRLILQEVLLEQVPEPTYFEKVAAWFAEKLPLDVD